MAKILKKNKKIVQRHPKRKEVEIPVFVIGKKEKVIVPEIKNVRMAEKKDFGIVRDRDDLPVFENFSATVHGRDDEEKIEEELQGERARMKSAIHKKGEEGSTREEKKREKKPPLPESRKRIIMWGSVAVFACLIFFIWLSSLKNNFSDLLGSSSYTFLRADGILEEVGENINMEESKNQNVPPEEEALGSEETGSGEGALDQIKEKILVEELKNKL